MIKGRDKKGRERVDDVISRAVSTYRMQQLKEVVERSEVPSRDSVSTVPDTTTGRRHNLPTPPSWWGSDSKASTDSMAAMQEIKALTNMKG